MFRQMEKLIELLNEYEKETKKSEYYEWEKGIGGPFLLFRRDTYDEEGSHLYSDTADTYVISKKYGFIGWLVENEKIDRSKFEIMSHSRLGEDEYFDEFFHCIMSKGKKEIREEYSDYESLLMLLSIQDNPIEFLVSILK